jgi:hypothetical protein
VEGHPVAQLGDGRGRPPDGREPGPTDRQASGVGEHQPGQAPPRLRLDRRVQADADPARIPLTALHPRDNQELPIGVTVELDERADAAWGAWRVSKTAAGDEAWSWPATASRSGSAWGSWKSRAVAAGRPTAAA